MPVVLKLQHSKFKGRRFIFPDWVWLEQAETPAGIKFTYTCLKHGIENIPMDGCDKCQEEKKDEEKN